MSVKGGWRHFWTVTRHKWYVAKGCFRVGLYYQGIMHDMSKYGPTEFLLGAKYYQGIESPHNGERRAYGFSYGWLHHKGRNKHHFEYWTDYGEKKEDGFVGIKMPKKYVVEMFMDRIAASKNYGKGSYDNEKSWEYYLKGKDWYIIHPDSKKLLERLLWMLKEHGEDVVYYYIKTRVLEKDFEY